MSPAVLEATSTQPRLQLTPHQVLQLIEPCLRTRLGTPAWDDRDRTAARVLLAVGDQQASTAERDQAITDALTAGTDPWLAALHADQRTPPRPCRQATDTEHP